MKSKIGNNHFMIELAQILNIFIAQSVDQNICYQLTNMSITSAEDVCIYGNKKGDEVDSKNCKECDECSHQESMSGQWCYMFIKRPDCILPCKQHDKYDLERKVISELVMKNSSLFTYIYKMGDMADFMGRLDKFEKTDIEIADSGGKNA